MSLLYLSEQILLKSSGELEPTFLDVSIASKLVPSFPGINAQKVFVSPHCAEGHPH